MMKTLTVIGIGRNCEVTRIMSSRIDLVPEKLNIKQFSGKFGVVKAIAFTCDDITITLHADRYASVINKFYRDIDRSSFDDAVKNACKYIARSFYYCIIEDYGIDYAGKYIADCDDLTKGDKIERADYELLKTALHDALNEYMDQMFKSVIHDPEAE